MKLGFERSKGKVHRHDVVDYAATVSLVNETVCFRQLHRRESKHIKGPKILGCAAIVLLDARFLRHGLPYPMRHEFADRT
jgi:hypothetical protein